MRSTILRLAQHVRTPSIQFLGPKWKEPQPPHAPRAHPMAPKEIADDFQSFLAKLQSTSTSPSNPSSNPKGQTPADSAQGKVNRSTESSSGSNSDKEDVWRAKEVPVDFEYYWEAPEKLWKVKEWSEREIEAVMCAKNSPGLRGLATSEAVTSAAQPQKAVASPTTLDTMHRLLIPRSVSPAPAQYSVTENMLAHADEQSGGATDIRSGP